jgi:uncharacterized YigZ family protein
MNVLRSNCSAEITVRNSRFLAEAFAVSAQDAARSIIKAQKARHADATHVVHAFVIGPTGGVLGSSDDGEPSGTAGRPALDVLKGSGLTNTMVTVTRWFGGTLLGTGGLVKAYSDAVKAVLAVADTAELVEMRLFSLSVSYEVYERVKREMAARDIEVTREEFGTDILVRGRVRADAAAGFGARVADLTAGRSTVSFGQEGN